MKSMEKITGLITAPFTAFDDQGAVDYSIIDTYAQGLAAAGVAGVFICGTTGEGLSLSCDERMRMTEAWRKAAPDGFKIIVHVGHNSYTESMRLARHAEETGCYGIGSNGPCFYSVANVDDLVDYCGRVAAAAPSLPFYYYHMPVMTGVAFNMVDFLAAAQERIPNLAGVKFTHENLMDFQSCLTGFDSKFDMLFGRDEILLSALVTGAVGAIGSTYNYMPRLYLEIMELYRNGHLDEARTLQQESMNIIRLMLQNGGPLICGKVLMKLAGLDIGGCRLPLRSADTAVYAKLQEALKQTRFQEFRLNYT